MMVFRLTQKLAKKIKADSLSSRPAEPNPFLDWCAHLFTADRTQYIIVSNTASLYSIMLFGRGIADEHRFLVRTMGCMNDFLEDDQCGFIYHRLIVPHASPKTFAKVGDRRVTGSINELVQQAKILLAEGGISPYDTAFRLNDIPMALLDFMTPREAFTALKMPGAGG